MVRFPQLRHAQILPHVHVSIETAALVSGRLRESVDDVLRRGWTSQVLKGPCHALLVMTHPLVCYEASACKRSAESLTLKVQELQQGV